VLQAKLDDEPPRRDREAIVKCVKELDGECSESRPNVEGIAVVYESGSEE
jgi:hypothetical protein